MLITDIGDYPSLKDVEDLNLPVAHADISECSTYAVVCRLRLSPPFTITSFGGSFKHPDYPDVSVTIPENAVPSGTEFSVQLQVGYYSLLFIHTYIHTLLFFPPQMGFSSGTMII